MNIYSHFARTTARIQVRKDQYKDPDPKIRRQTNLRMLVHFFCLVSVFASSGNQWYQCVREAWCWQFLSVVFVVVFVVFLWFWSFDNPHTIPAYTFGRFEQQIESYCTDPTILNATKAPHARSKSPRYPRGRAVSGEFRKN